MLAAGAGTRLRPLTDERPKALCPVAGRALVDGAIERVRAVTPDVAVNVHHGRAQMEAHLAGQVYLSVEHEQALGTAGALGKLRDWIAGRAVLVHNADAWLCADLTAFAEGWDGERIRLLTAHRPGSGDWGDRQYAGAALLPWREVAPLAAEPSGLYEVSWRRHHPDTGLELIDHAGAFIDCGTPSRYLQANMVAGGGRSVIGAGARVQGTVERAVLWEGAVVRRGEHLVDGVRTGSGMTVLVRR